jgi:peptidoglycan/xylan/chitin deacetylase (PgdA/CDA1 family)
MSHLLFRNPPSDYVFTLLLQNLIESHNHTKAEKIVIATGAGTARSKVRKTLPGTHWLWLILRNPLVIVLPLIIVLGLAWRQYAYSGRDLSLATPNLNVLPNANFEQFTSTGLPRGWQLVTSGDSQVTTQPAPGYVSGNSVGLSVQHYKMGDVALVSPKMDLRAATSYLFKGYYESDAPFELLADYYYKDGTNLLKFVANYPNEKGVWSTVSDAIETGNNLTAVQYTYRLATNGNLRLNGFYLEPKRETYIAPQVSTVNNVIPNEQLVTSSSSMPVSWATYRAGNNTAAFSYFHETGRVYLQTKISNYQSGEAKWQFLPQPVTGHQYYQFGFQYKSDTSAQVVADYVFPDGHQQFVTLAEITPASQWTAVTQPLETPPGVAAVFVSVVLQSNGTLATSDYSLVNTTQPGAGQWKRPLVSITFDDGWESSFNNGVPLLDRYGYKATFYINPSSIETPSFMHASQLAALRDKGNEIAAHGYSHDDMTAISSSQLNFQLQEGRDYLGRAGFPTADFATPYGKSDAEVQWYARKYFSTLRGTETGLNTRQNLEPYNLKVVYLEVSTSDKEVAAALKDAKQYNGWVIFVYHRVGLSRTAIGSLKVERPALAEESVSKQLSLIHDSGIAVATVAAAYKEVANQ